MITAVYNALVEYLTTISIWEIIAVITALAYVIFAARENILCWYAALISTALYTVIFYDVYLWMDSLLQVYYLVMAVYGWYCWQNRKSEPESGLSSAQALSIQSWSSKQHFIIIAILTVISLVIGKLMATFTPTHFPYLDSATTVFAVFATYLVTQKVLENWLYWVVIDFVSIYLYIEKGLLATAGLFIIYVVIAAYGYIAWRKRFSSELVPASA